MTTPRPHVGTGNAALAWCAEYCVVVACLAVVTMFGLLRDNRVRESLCEAAGVYDTRRVVLFGDSIMAQFVMVQHFGFGPYVNRSQGGRRAVASHDAFVAAIAGATDVVILLGTNDLGTGGTPRQVADAVEDMGTLAVRQGVRVLVFSAVPVAGPQHAHRSPQQVALLNRDLSAMCLRHGFVCGSVPSCMVNADGWLNRAYSSDGLHLNNSGRALLAGAIRDVVEHGAGPAAARVCGQ